MNESAAEKAFRNRTHGYSAHGLMMEIPGNHAFLADQYLEAAQALQAASADGRWDRIAPIPFFFCIFQSVELSLKSFLGAKGRDCVAGWRTHDVAQLLNCAAEEGLELSDTSKEIIRQLNEQHKGMELRFMDRRGVVYMPPDHKMVAAAAELRASIGSVVRPFIRPRSRI
jgi:hypothetical protein